MTFWIVRAGRHGEHEQEALDENITTIRWSLLPDLSKISKKEELETLYRKSYSDEKKRRAASRIGQVWRFAKEINVGDLIALPLKTQKSLIAIGEVVGDYEYKDDSLETKHRRKIKWEEPILRSAFDQDILNSFGTHHTVARVQTENAEQRVRNMLNDDNSLHLKQHLDDDDDAMLDLEQISKDTIIKLIERKFLGHDLERLINGIFISKGYTTRLSPPGPDGGVDIFASSGNLGFDEPKICIQVKSSRHPVDVKILKDLEDVTKNFGANYAILISWGGFKITNKEISRSFFTTKLWDQDKIVDELIDNYDNLDSDLKSEIPLKKMWTIIEE